MKSISKLFFLAPLFLLACELDEIEDTPSTISKDNWRIVDDPKTPDPNDPPDPNPSEYIYNVHEWYSQGYSRIYSAGGSCEIRAYYGYGALSFASAGMCSSGSYGGIEKTAIDQLGSSFEIEVKLDADYIPSSYNTPIGAIELGSASSNYLTLVFYGPDEVFLEYAGSGNSFYLSREFTSEPEFRLHYENNSLKLYEVVGSSENFLGEIPANLSSRINHLSYGLNVDYPWEVEEFIIY